MWRWRKPPQLLRLLQAAAQGRTDLPLSALDEGHLRWALETGLGPLLWWVTQDDPGAVTSPWWPLVRGAERTAALLAAEQQSALSELLDACAGRMAPLVLLKGISISTQYYPVPW